MERLQYLLQVAFSQQAQWLPGENKQLKAEAEQSIAIQGYATTVELQLSSAQSQSQCQPGRPAVAVDRNHLNKSQCHAM